MSVDSTADVSGNPEIGLSVEAGGIRTNYHDRGSGDPVVLIHGSGPGVSAWANWRLCVDPLAQQLRVLAPDMVGFGYTDTPTDVTYDLDLWRRHLTSFLDALDVDRVHLIGNSFGGALALNWTTHYPDRVGKLVLMGSAGLDFPLTAGLDMVWGYTPGVENMAEVLRTMAYDQALVADGLAEMRYRASMRPGVQEAYASMFPAPRQRGVELLATPESEIATIDKDVLIVHGRDDRVIPLESSLRLLSLLDRSQLHVFGQCGHWTQIERAAGFVTLVTDFLARRDQ